jgi:hypothetical protein
MGLKESAVWKGVILQAELSTEERREAPDTESSHWRGNKIRVFKHQICDWQQRPLGFSPNLKFDDSVTTKLS